MPANSKPQPKNKATFAILLLLISGALIVLFKSQTPAVPMNVELQNYFGTVEIYSAETKAWQEASRGQALQAKDKIRTGAKSEALVRFQDQYQTRVNENSVIQILSGSQVELSKGSFVASSTPAWQESLLKIKLPKIKAQLGKGSIFVSVPEEDPAWVGALRGDVKVTEAGKTQALGSFQKVEAGKNLEAKQVTSKDWFKMREAYDLIFTSAAQEAAQLDLSKQAGSLFDVIFDHGTFFTPKMGFARREFSKDEAQGEVTLEMEYDVFPVGSFVGVYLKTREFDLSNFSGMNLDVKRVQGEDFPDNVRIEMKDRSGLQRVFVIKNIREKWETQEFPFQASKETPVSEIAFVFTHAKGGPSKRGMIHLKNLELIPKEKA